jgi:signal transduction histidine kinase
LVDNPAGTTVSTGARTGKMSSQRRARLTLFVALLLLALSGIGASVAISQLYLTEVWVRHTYSVEVALGDVESALTAVGNARVAYINSGTPAALQTFQDAMGRVPLKMARIRFLTADNPTAVPLCDQLQQDVQRRLDPSIASVELARSNQKDSVRQMQLTMQVAEAAIATAAVEQQMRDNEDKLLMERNYITQFLFGLTIGILAVSFTVAAVMFLIHNRMLQKELRDKEAVESRLRQLSVQLLRVRDDEARRFARELHDGLGQTMVAAKMMAESLSYQNSANPKFNDLAKLIQEAAAQTRTISYLLHPPMLDELGFASAAEWFIEGFAKRTGIDVALRISPGVAHLPKDLELALFRILQEALTNIQRHSQSVKAEASIAMESQEVTMVVRDFGKGIPQETLAHFKKKGTHVGVGLAGMKERVMEFNGEMEIQSNEMGTRIIVRMPVTARPDLSIPSIA